MNYAELIAKTIDTDYRNTFNATDTDYNIYYGDDKSTFNLGTAFYHALEEKHGRVLEVFKYDFRRTDKRVNYLVCRTSVYGKGIKEACLDSFDATQRKKENFIQSLMIDDGYYIIYRVSGI